MVDKNVRGLKSALVAVVALFDTESRPDGSALSVNYGARDRFKLVSNAHSWPAPSGLIPCLRTQRDFRSSLRRHAAGACRLCQSATSVRRVRTPFKALAIARLSCGVPP